METHTASILYDVYWPLHLKAEKIEYLNLGNPTQRFQYDVLDFTQLLLTWWLFPDVDVLVLMVTNEYQAESVLYGKSGAVAGMGL